MRTDETLRKVIMDYAINNESIRAVFENGSRVNKEAKKDIFQDFDIVYVVDDIAPMLNNKEWINQFGEIMILEEPKFLDSLKGELVCFTDYYNFLMQFMDGLRLDLTLVSVDKATEYLSKDSLTSKLLDKDSLYKNYVPSLESHYIKEPYEGDFVALTKDFWWVSVYVAKGLWRGEFSYAVMHFYECLYPKIITLLSWYAAKNNDFQISTGKMGKYLDRYIDEKTIFELNNVNDFTTAAKGFISLKKLCHIFFEYEKVTGEMLGFIANMDEAQRVLDYINDISLLDKKAKRIR